MHIYRSCPDHYILFHSHINSSSTLDALRLLQVISPKGRLESEFGWNGRLT